MSTPEATAREDARPPIGPGDVALGVGIAALSIVGTFFASQQGEPIRRPFDAGAAVLVSIASLALIGRRRWPLGVMAVVFATTFVYLLIGYHDGPIWIPLVISYFSAASRAGHRLIVAGTALVGFVLFPWMDHLVRGAPGPTPASLAALAAWLLVIFGAAEIVRIRRERLAEAARMQREEALRRAGEERLRIARELHDALGHHLSLISVQSGVALHLNEELPEQARASLTAIRDASKEALTELRSVLEILRQNGEAAPRSPGLTLARLDDLVDRSEKAGLRVRTQTEGQVRPLPFGVDAAAFRVVQEALTNVTRHAGRASATVRIVYGEDDVTVQIEDDGHGSSTGPSVGGGTGIAGMRDRVSALGGELEAGPRPEGGFRVRARMPLEVGS